MDSRELTIDRHPTLRVARLASLTKPRQTLLLLVTSAGAYALSLPGGIRWQELLLGTAALWAAIAGCTVLNMVLDRDIDTRMARTAGRPLPTGEVSVTTAVSLGTVLSVAGLVLACSLGAAFGAVVVAGLAIDLGVYTAWLKRRTPLSILLGGVAGGMPALAGRTLALGRIDLVGVLLALAVLLWIPAHILTLAMRRSDEFDAAGIPAWPCVFGDTATRRLIASTTVASAAVLLVAGILLRTPPTALWALFMLGSSLSILAIFGLWRPSDRHDLMLFKAASIYMAAAFGCLVVGVALA